MEETGSSIGISILYSINFFYAFSFEFFFLFSFFLFPNFFNLKLFQPFSQFFLVSMLSMRKMKLFTFQAIKEITLKGIFSCLHSRSKRTILVTQVNNRNFIFYAFLMFLNIIFFIIFFYHPNRILSFSFFFNFYFLGHIIFSSQFFSIYLLCRTILTTFLIINRL